MLFNTNKLSKSESDTVLATAITFLNDGKSLMASLNFTGQIFEGNIQKVLLLLEDDFTNNSVPMADACLTYGLLNEEEAPMLVSKESKTATIIETIIDLRKYGSNYEKILLSSLRSPILIAIVTFFAMYYYADTMYAEILDIKISSIKEAYTKPDLSFISSYLTNKNILLYWGISLIFLTISSIFTYSYFYKTNRSIIYKIFKKKPYDDTPKMFKLMIGMRLSNIDTINIYRKMKDIPHYSGLSSMFAELEECVINNEKYSPIFQQYNFPKDIILTMKSKEDNEFWDGIESLIAFSTQRADTEFAKMKAMWGTINMFLPWIVPFYFMFDIGVMYMLAAK
ncbi:MAG: hypothetical protein U9O87_09240 [Verrucomicrobiota bacterium]|nr:hypothetical protein [Verrucomicrobiota bacterium]